MNQAARRGPGRPKGPALTAGDLAALDQIGRNGFQTFQELREGALASKSREHAWRRLKVLCQRGLLRENVGDTGAVLGWTLDRVGVSKRIEGREQEWNLKARPPLYKTAYAHDQALRKIRAILCQSPGIRAWVPEHVLKADMMRKLQHLHSRDREQKLITVPDALLHLETEGVASKAALELELTRKARRRLYLKFESYLTSTDIDFALFIVQGDALRNTLKAIHLSVLEKSAVVRLKPQPNGIYFAELSKILADGLAAEFSGVHDSFSFADLRRGHCGFSVTA